MTPITKKIYYSWMIPPDDDSDEPIVKVKSEEDLLNEYFPIWSEKMKKAGKESLISKENFFEEFCSENWASKIRAKP